MKIKLILILFLVVTLFSCSVSDDTKKLMSIDQKMNNGQYAEAIQESNKYVQNYPKSFKGWNLLGWAYLKTDQLEKAEQCFNKSIIINEKWDNAYVGKGVLYRKIGNSNKSKQSYLKAIELVPDNAEAFSSLLVIELMEGNDKKAVEYGEHAWKLRKNYPSIPANLAVAYHYLGNLKKRDEFFNLADKLGYHNMQALEDIFNGKASIR